MQSHDELIKDQFTRQAKPFSRVKWHNHEELLKLIVQSVRLQPDDKVLDVACGPGIVACEAAKTAAFVAGVDLTPAMIDLARDRQKAMNLHNMEWRVGDVRALGWSDESFTVVVTRFSFHHFLKPKNVFNEMCRVAKPGARVAVIDVYVSEDKEEASAYDAMEKLRDPSHTRALTLRELAKIYGNEGLESVTRDFFRLEVELEKQLESSFPNPGDADKIRRLMREDLTKNRLGVDTHMKDGKIYFSYPIVVMTGVIPRA